MSAHGACPWRADHHAAARVDLESAAVQVARDRVRVDAVQHHVDTRALAQQARPMSTGWSLTERPGAL